MKRILPTLLCLFSISLFAQMTTTVQVMLKPGFFFNDYDWLNTSSDYTVSNDLVLNQILNNHSVETVEETGVFVENSSVYSSSLGIIYTDSETALAIVNDLNAYTSVVYKASIEQFEGKYNYYLFTKLSNLTDGNYVSTDSNGLVVTSNAQLNVIFQQFNVNYYELAFPGVTSLFNVFALGCQFCNTVNLKTAIEGLEGTVLTDNSTENIPYIILLNTDSNELEKNLTLFPNPTNGFFEIKIDAQLQDFDLEIFDSNGRIVYTDKMNTLQNNSQTIDISSLTNGVYFLRIKNEEFAHTKKIIKK